MAPEPSAHPADPDSIGPDQSPISGESHGSWSEPGDVIVLSQGDFTLVLLHGEIDIRLSDELEQAGRFCLDHERRTIMDVRHLTMMDSVGLSFVIRLAVGLQAPGSGLYLQGPSPRLSELLSMVGATELVAWLEDWTPSPTRADQSSRARHIDGGP